MQKKTLFGIVISEITPVERMRTTPREERILTLLAQGMSYNDIGQEFAVTKERIMQIARKAVRKVRTARKNAGKPPKPLPPPPVEQQKFEMAFNAIVDSLKDRPREEISTKSIFSPRLVSCLKRWQIENLAQLEKEFGWLKWKLSKQSRGRIEYVLHRLKWKREDVDTEWDGHEDPNDLSVEV